MRFAFFLLSTLTLVTPSHVQAHGPYPRSRDLDIASDGAMLITTSFGLLVSNDAGNRWSWTCVNPLGFQLEDDPPLSATLRPQNVMHAASPFGLYRYETCSWTPPTEFERSYHSALVRDRSNDTLWTLTSNADSENFVYHSADGVTWGKVGPALPQLLFESLAVVEGTEDQVFVGAISPETAPNPRTAVVLTLEQGAWTRTELGPIDRLIAPEMLVTSVPAPAAPIVALTNRSSGEVVQTLRYDGGSSNWSEMETFTGKRVTAATWNKDASTLWIGGRFGVGIWQSTNGGLTFEQTNQDIEVGCLVHEVGTLYVCGDQFADGYMLGTSLDGGSTVDPLSSFDSIKEELPCARSTDVGGMCQGPALDVQNDIEVTFEPVSVASDGCALAITSEKQQSFPLAPWVIALACLTSARRRAQ